MASEVTRFAAWAVSDIAANAAGTLTVVHAADHDRVVAELRSHVRTDNSAVIAGLREQMAEARDLLGRAKYMLGLCYEDMPTIRDIDAWLEKTK